MSCTNCIVFTPTTSHVHMSHIGSAASSFSQSLCSLFCKKDVMFLMWFCSEHHAGIPMTTVMRQTPPSPPSVLRLHPHILLQVTTKYRVFPLIPHFLTFPPPFCLTATHPSPLWRLPQVRGLSGVVGLKIKSRNTRISSSTHHPSADSSLTHRLLIQGHECCSLSWKAN